MAKLHIIGNGFDLEHGIPTSFNKDFRIIAERNETVTYFWDMYQTKSACLWSDFENLLAHPSLTSLESIYDGYFPDYTSERESDRDAIINISMSSGRLRTSIKEFASIADQSLNKTQSISKYRHTFSEEDIFISFNYTHTLEKLYEIDASKVLFVHGESGKSELVIGYQGEFLPDDILEDPRGKGRGPYRVSKPEEYIASIEDSYVQEAYKILYKKLKSFYKIPNLSEVEEFLSDSNITEIYFIGHSANIDFPYFVLLNDLYPDARWFFEPYKPPENQISETEENILKMIDQLGIANFEFIQIDL